MKNILMLITDIGGGGAQKVFSQLSEELAKRGYNIIECIFEPNEKYRYSSTNKVIYLSSKHKISFLRLIERIQILRRIKKEHSIDATISHLSGANYINVFSGGSTILCQHGTIIFDHDQSKLKRFINHIIIFTLYRFATFITPVSASIKQELNKYFFIPNKKIRPINNFFYPDRILSLSNCRMEDSLIDELRQDKENFILIGAGRLSKQKNFEALIKIFSEVNKVHPKSKLIILGSGERIDSLINFSAKLGLKAYESTQNMLISNIADYDLFFLGHQDNPFYYIKNSDLFVLPSLWEGFPLILCEAMLCKVPVVSSNCYTGPNEILSDVKDVSSVSMGRNKYGYILPVPEIEKVHTIQHWVDTISSIIGQENDKKPLEEAYNKAISFSVDRAIKEWVNLIERK
jgi:glycosyltransferase involved in cell wall biosynthesis